MTEQALEHQGRLFRCLSLMPICVEILLQMLQEIDDDDEWNSCASRSSRYGNFQFQRRDDFLGFEKFKPLQAEFLKPYTLVDA